MDGSPATAGRLSRWLPAFVPHSQDYGVASSIAEDTAAATDFRIRVSHSDTATSENEGDLFDDAQQPARVRAAFSLAKEDQVNEKA